MHQKHPPEKVAFPYFFSVVSIAPDSIITRFSLNKKYTGSTASKKAVTHESFIRRNQRKGFILFLS